jgi:hypothetical protein
MPWTPTGSPPGSVPKRRPVDFRHPALRIHAAVAVVISALLIVRWAVSDAPFFFPAIPMFWLAMSLLVHSRLRGVRSRRTAAVS